MKSEPSPREAAESGDESFRLISIKPAPAPSGHTGRDWLAYRIAQGKNIITGYRRGDLKAVTAEVAILVKSLNERRHSSKPKPGRKAGARSAAEAAAPKEDKDDAE
jgi:hypothetical protein